MPINDPRISAFQLQPFQAGLDLGRCIINNSPGIFQAALTSVFRAGSIVAQNSSGQIVPCVGNTATVPAGIPLGIAKWNKATQLYAAQQDERVVLTGVIVSNLAHSNIFNDGGVAGVRVTSGPSSAEGTLYTEGGGGDYTVNYTNGTIVRTAGSTIPTPGTVYVDYLYPLTEQDLDFQGRNFFNFTDDVSIQDSRITIITNWGMIFTTQYDPSVAYVVGAPLYCGQGNKAGLFTSVSGGGRPYVGRCIQYPSAADPYLGVQFTGQAPAV